MQLKFKAVLLIIKGKQVWWVAQLEVDSPDIYRYICPCDNELIALQTAEELTLFHASNTRL